VLTVLYQYSVVEDGKYDFKENPKSDLDLEFVRNIQTGSIASLIINFMVSRRPPLLIQ